MAKEKSINPAQAQRKAEKAKAVKKGKAEQAARRAEKLSHRNPERLQKQVDDLKAVESSGGKLTSHEKKVLEELERDIKAVRKAREALGDKAPPLRSARPFQDGARDGGRGDGVLGKRRRGGWGRNGEDGSDSGSDVPEDVKSIPMPRDTPPPIPKEILDKWYKARRERAGYTGGGEGRGTSANNVPLGGPDRRGMQSHSGAGVDRVDGGLPQRAARVAEAKTVYEAAPVIRDLRKEAVSAFVPAAVRVKMEKMKGSLGSLVEPEEADRLESEGYLGYGDGKGTITFPGEKNGTSKTPRSVTIEDAQSEED